MEYGQQKKELMEGEDLYSEDTAAREVFGMEESHLQNLGILAMTKRCAGAVEGYLNR